MCSQPIHHKFIKDSSMSDLQEHHNTDEMDAALGLLLLHYQSVDRINSTNQQQFDMQAPSPTTTPTIELKTKNHYDYDMFSSTANSIIRPLLNNRRDKRYEPFKRVPTIHLTLRQKPDENNQNNIRSKKNSTLLASCRNILKDFLGQNGFQ